MSKDDEKRNPKVPEFQDLTDGYRKSEELAHKVKFENSLSTAFQKLRDIYGGAGEKELLHKCQLELEVQSFVFREGKVHPMFVMNSPFPDLSKYSASDLDYLKERHSKVGNPTLKARYAHLLWESKSKHIDFARSAIDSYFESINLIKTFELEEPKKSRGHRIKTSIESLWILSQNVSYRKQEAIDLIVETCQTYDYSNPSSSSVRLFLVNLTLEYWKELGPSLLPHIETVFDKQKDKTDLFGVMDWLLVLGKVNNKSKLQTVNWRLQLAQVYEQLADSFGKENPASIEYIAQAIELYKSMKNASKVSELERKYDEGKKSIRLGSYQQSLDLTEQANAAFKYGEALIDEHGTSILTFLRETSDLIPKVSEIRTESETMLADLPLQQDMPQSVLDHRGNTVEHFTTPDEIKKKFVLQTYEFHIECEKILLLRAIFLHGIKKNVITAELFEAYLNSETWLSLKRQTWSPAVETEESFVDLIIPSLRYFIEQTKSAIDNEKYRPDFVLCCDSLALKFEALLRDLCEQNKEPTFFMRDDKSGRKVVNEQDINALLYSETVKRLFSEDELFFLRYVLIEKAGKNWRHKVAHALSYKPEYSFQLMALLVMCLIILARKKV